MPPPFHLDSLTRLQRALLATYVDAIGNLLDSFEQSGRDMLALLPSGS